MQATVGVRGALGVRKIGAQVAPLSWRLQNALRWAYIAGWLEVVIGRFMSKLLGLPVLTSELRVRLRKAGGEWVDYGIVSFRKVTDTGVALLVDDWQAGTPRINDFKYAGCGTGAVAENKTDTALGAECTTALLPDSTRATCTMTQPTAPVVRAVGTLTFDAGAAVTEHGILNQAATGGGVLWDRHNFAAINVVSGDSICGALPA